MNPGDYLLVIATSARMLTQSASRLGYKVLAIDCFADVDLKAAAFDFCQVKSLALTGVESAVDGFIHQYGVQYAISGSGFEYHIDTLAFLHSHLTLFSNLPSCYLALQNKPEFFQNLVDLNIQHPETVFTPPRQTKTWLSKPFLHEGGQGIDFYPTEKTHSAAIYYQQYLEGQVASVLFVADGKKVGLIAYNQQWSRPGGFEFSGVINAFQPTRAQQTILRTWLEKLVPLYGLMGLNCLDFIINDDQCYLLEINPRPSASMQLYPDTILAAHMDAFQGKLTGFLYGDEAYTAYQIIYAETEIKIPYNMRWCKCSADIPVSGAAIDRGQPVCSLIVRGKEPGLLFKRLKNKQNFIKKQLISR